MKEIIAGIFAVNAFCKALEAYCQVRLPEENGSKKTFFPMSSTAISETMTIVIRFLSIPYGFERIAVLSCVFPLWPTLLFYYSLRPDGALLSKNAAFPLCILSKR